jgi:hypothetical protein
VWSGQGLSDARRSGRERRSDSQRRNDNEEERGTAFRPELYVVERSICIRSSGNTHDILFSRGALGTAVDLAKVDRAISATQPSASPKP